VIIEAEKERYQKFLKKGREQIDVNGMKSKNLVISPKKIMLKGFYSNSTNV
jgi:hypothetical protein